MRDHDYNKSSSKDSGKNMIFGIHPILEALAAGKEFEKLFIQANARNSQLSEIRTEAGKLGFPVQEVPSQKLDRFTRKNHQGIVAFLSLIEYRSLDNIVDEVYSKGEMPLILVLDRVTDVRNFGSIARNADAMGAHAIVIPAKGGAQINSDGLKASAGALNHIPVCREKFLDQTIEYLKNSGIKVVGCTEKGDSFVQNQDFKEPTAIIMGSEENGISDKYLKMCDAQVKIPMLGNVGSLNVSVACGMILYEVVRQRVE